MPCGHEKDRLRPQRHGGERAEAVVVEFNQIVGAVNVVDVGRAHHHQSDTHKAHHQRDHEPAADAGDDLTLAPPGRARIAGRPASQQREVGANNYGSRKDLERVAPATTRSEYSSTNITLSLVDAKNRSIRYLLARLRKGLRRVWRARPGGGAGRTAEADGALQRLLSSMVCPAGSSPGKAAA